MSVRLPRRHGIRAQSRPVSTSQRGVPVSPEDVKDREAMRERLGPVKSLETLEAFAKWIFASVAVVGTLGTAFSLLDLGSLSDDAQTLFGIAVACAGISLALAALAVAPQRANYNRHSAESMRRVLAAGARRRFVILTFAAVFFAGALVVAALAPIISTSERREAHHGFVLSIDSKRRIDVGFDIGRGQPRSFATLAAKPVPAAKGRVQPRTIVALDGRGQAALRLKVRAGSKTRRVVVTATWVDRAGERVVSRKTIKIRRR